MYLPSLLLAFFLYPNLSFPSLRLAFDTLFCSFLHYSCLFKPFSVLSFTTPGFPYPNLSFPSLLLCLQTLLCPFIHDLFTFSKLFVFFTPFSVPPFTILVFPNTFLSFHSLCFCKIRPFYVLGFSQTFFPFSTTITVIFCPLSILKAKKIRSVFCIFLDCYYLLEHFPVHSYIYNLHFVLYRLNSKQFTSQEWRLRGFQPRITIRNSFLLSPKNILFLAVIGTPLNVLNYFLLLLIKMYILKA